LEKQQPDFLPQVRRAEAMHLTQRGFCVAPYQSAFCHVDKELPLKNLAEKLRSPPWRRRLLII
jgi:hypothetical protein